MPHKDEIKIEVGTLADIDLYLKALSTLLRTLRLDLTNSMKALGAVEESIQKTLRAIQEARKFN
jgi:hypothetical protein